MARVPCPCGEASVWYRAATTPESAPEGAACLLTDDDFADNYCDVCFPRAVSRHDRTAWRRLPAEDDEEAL